MVTKTTLHMKEHSLEPHFLFGIFCIRNQTVSLSSVSFHQYLILRRPLNGLDSSEHQSWGYTMLCSKHLGTKAARVGGTTALKLKSFRKFWVFFTGEKKA